MRRPDEVTLARYLAGDSTPAEAGRVRDWLAADAANAAELAELERVLLAAAEAPAWDSSAAWDRVHAGLTPRIPRHGTAPVAQRDRAGARRDLRAWGLRAAAVFVLVGGAAAAAILLQQSGTRAAALYSTSPAERAEVLLHDGTRVHLNAATELRVAAGFGDDDRVVELRGEAYFDVTPDADRPFIVRTGSATTRVVGTRFSTRQYADDAYVTVVVEEGVVVLAGGDAAGVRLTAAQVGVLPVSGGPATVTSVDAAARLSWRTGQLSFHDSPLATAVRDLARWYGRPFAVADPALAQRRVTARLTTTDSAAEAGELLALIVGASATLRGDTITFVTAR